MNSPSPSEVEPFNPSNVAQTKAAHAAKATPTPASNSSQESPPAPTAPRSPSTPVSVPPPSNAGSPVANPLAEEQATKKRKNYKPSPVREYFTAASSPKPGLSCKECAKLKVSCVLSDQGPSSSHLHNHLRSKHPSVYNSIKSTEATASGTDVLRTWANGCNLSFDTDTFCNLLVRMVVIESLPFNVVSAPALQDLVQYLNQKANLPSRTTITRHVSSLLDEVQPRIREVLHSIPGSMSVTMGMWSLVCL